MNAVTTTSGYIVNLDQLAMITVKGRYADEPVEKSILTLHFPAVFSSEKGGRSMRLELLGSEAIEFLKSLEERGVKVQSTLKSLNEKVIERR